MPDEFSIGVGDCRAGVGDRCFTGTVQQTFESFREEEPGPKMAGKGTRAPEVSSDPSQGSLNISAPTKKPGSQIDDELDIPTFLRRQAN